jgi:predicted HTH transcriptional regulator
MSEDQDIEFKESWRDEYLKWICGFANAQGGKIYLGKESWGRGTIKIIKECKQAGIPEPVFSYDSSDITVEFRKDIFYEQYLKSLNLNDR